jgi:hypothetical protein
MTRQVIDSGGDPWVAMVMRRPPGVSRCWPALRERADSDCLGPGVAPVFWSGC